MAVLVTGGAGYIGSVCAARLLEAGHRVTIVDDLSTGHRDAAPDGARFIEADVADVAHTLLQEGFDGVLHFAAEIHYNNVEMLDLLTQFGLDLNGYETDELLPLQIIADGDDEENTKHCRMAMFQYVLDRTCDVDATNNQRQTTLDYCYAMKHPDISNNIRRIELLLEKGAVPYGSSPGSTSPDSASPGSVSPPVAKDTSYAESLW
jgi:hypothetical protein